MDLQCIYVPKNSKLVIMGKDRGMTLLCPHNLEDKYVVELNRLYMINVMSLIEIIFVI